VQSQHEAVEAMMIQAIIAPVTIALPFVLRCYERILRNCGKFQISNKKNYRLRSLAYSWILAHTHILWTDWFVHRLQLSQPRLRQTEKMLAAEDIIHAHLDSNHEDTKKI
jgi:hypothetical protein